MTSAKHAILDLLSASRGSLPVRGLVRAAKVLEIPENSLRVALSRLKQDGLVVSPKRGHYALGEIALGVHALVSTWRSPRNPQVPWDGEWLAASTSGRPSPAAARGLRLLGMRPLRPELYIRPQNLRGGLAAHSARLRRASVDADLVFLVRFDPADDSAARHLWDTGSIASGHQRMVCRLDEARRAIDRLPLDAAAKLAFEVGGEAIRRIALDPLLPAVMLEHGPLDALVASMVEFDQEGRGLWQSVLEDDANLGRRSPAAVAQGDLGLVQDREAPR